MDSALNRICVIEGTIKGSEDGIHCRIIVRMNVDGDVEQVPSILAGSQHYSMAFGHWAGALQETAGVLGFAVERLQMEGCEHG